MRQATRRHVGVVGSDPRDAGELGTEGRDVGRWRRVVPPNEVRSEPPQRRPEGPPVNEPFRAKLPRRQIVDGQGSQAVRAGQRRRRPGGTEVETRSKHLDVSVGRERAGGEQVHTLATAHGRVNPWVTTATRRLPASEPSTFDPLARRGRATISPERARYRSYSAACARIVGSYRRAAYEHRPRPFGSQVEQFLSAGTAARTWSDRICARAARSQCSSLSP